MNHWQQAPAAPLIALSLITGITEFIRADKGWVEPTKARWTIRDEVRIPARARGGGRAERARAEGGAMGMQGGGAPLQSNRNLLLGTRGWAPPPRV